MKEPEHDPTSRTRNRGFSFGPSSFSTDLQTDRLHYPLQLRADSKRSFSDCSPTISFPVTVRRTPPSPGVETYQGCNQVRAESQTVDLNVFGFQLNIPDPGRPGRISDNSFKISSLLISSVLRVSNSTIPFSNRAFSSESPRWHRPLPLVLHLTEIRLNSFALKQRVNYPGSCNTRAMTERAIASRFQNGSLSFEGKGSRYVPSCFRQASQRKADGGITFRNLLKAFAICTLRTIGPRPLGDNPNLSLSTRTSLASEP